MDYRGPRRLAALVQGLIKGGCRFGVRARVRREPLDGPGGEATRFTVEIGLTVSARPESHGRLTRGRAGASRAAGHLALRAGAHTSRDRDGGAGGPRPGLSPARA